ncbi:MAG: two-component regulator propeller domain-containing protein [Ignavibacteriota bacterium]
MFGTRLVVGVFLLCSARPILALDPDQPSTSSITRPWTAKDGLQGTVTSFAQTSDGFLWIGTTEGLFRFDGVKFEAYKPEAGSFPATAVLTLCAAREGLWIGYVAGGVSLLKNGRLRNYSSSDGLPISNISGIIEDGEGTIWVSAVGGLARLEGDRWHIVRMDWNYPSRAAEILTGDTRGTLWAATRHRIMFLPKGSRKFQDTGARPRSSPT